jgi:hypothetical protein
VAAYVPSSAEVLHYFQPSAEWIDVYHVPSDFYWKSVELGHPPPESMRVGRECGKVDWIDEPRLRACCGEGRIRPTDS